MAARKAANLTMKQVSEAAGIAESTYSLIESGKRSPSVKTAKKLAAVLRVDWTEFFREDDDHADDASAGVP